MAIITISRQVAALGDEIAAELAKQLNYKFIDRKSIEKKIVELGFPAEKLEKYDERKPGFFASLAKDRDEYLDFLQTAVYEAASEGNCILIGRGAFAILDSVPNCFSVRLIAPNHIRQERLMNEFSWTQKQAQERIKESDTNRAGFHKSFFNVENDDNSQFHLVLNTGRFGVEAGAAVIAELVHKMINNEQELLGNKKVRQMLVCQLLVNQLIFEYKLNINFLHAELKDDDTFVLHGVADSAALVEQALQTAKEIMGNKKIESCITIVQDFKSFT